MSRVCRCGAAATKTKMVCGVSAQVCDSCYITMTTGMAYDQSNKAWLMDQIMKLVPEKYVERT